MQRNLPSIKDALQTIIEAAHVPAVGYAHAEIDEKTENGCTSTSLTVGKKNALASDDATNVVDNHTRFPASSLSKIVFTYLVIKLVKEGRIDLDKTLLHDILPNKRFLVDGKYPDKAKQLTARHVLSHTTGLPNFGPNWKPDLSSTLPFINPELKLGEGYSYSGEAFYYLQQVIEKIMAKSLEELAKEYVFIPLEMHDSTFLPQPEGETNIVKVHTELGIPTSINEGAHHLNVANAAGSLLTTAGDFSKFMAAWLKEINNPLIQQAFNLTSTDTSMTCGLGWHIHRNEKETIAYQFGENTNTRSFVALNLNTRKGTALFTNSENGMSIANQIFNSSKLPSIGNMQAVYKDKGYAQSDEPGWQETLDGKIAEDKGNINEARNLFEKAASGDESKRRRFEWFERAHQSTQEKYAKPLAQFERKLTNPYNDVVMIYIRDGGLVCEQFGRKIKLVRISETEFLPEKDQSFLIIFNRDNVIFRYLDGKEKYLFTESQKAVQEAQHESHAVPQAVLDNARIPALSAAWHLNGVTHSLVGGIADPVDSKKADEFTLFQAASLSKPVSAAIILDLAAQGKWDLDKPLAEMGVPFGSDDMKKDPRYAKLTTRMIISQCSGLPNWFKSSPETFDVEPGTHFTYSGVAYESLKEVAKKTLGKTWGELAQDFFDKVGMEHSTFQLPEKTHLKDSTIARGYDSDGKPGPIPSPDGFKEVPAASLLTTAKDYVHFLRYCYSDLQLQDLFKSHTRLAPAEHFKEAHEKITWGFGMGVFKDGVKEIAFHWGNNPNSRAFCAIDMQTGNAVSCLVNSQNGVNVFQIVCENIVGNMKPVFEWLSQYDNFNAVVKSESLEALENILKRASPSVDTHPKALKRCCSTGIIAGMLGMSPDNLNPAPTPDHNIDELQQPRQTRRHSTGSIAQVSDAKSAATDDSAKKMTPK